MADPDQFVAADLACIRGERLVFGKVRFDIASGDALALVGPNGSGKSTLLRLLAGLLPASGGRLAWNGAPVGDEPDAHRARLHYLGHLDAVKPALTPLENLAFHARLRGEIRDAAALKAALDALGIAGLADLPGRFLSQGQRRRAALARLRATRAPLWLLDEPTLGLDADALVRLADLIDSHRSQGGIVIAATHGGLDLGPHTTLELGTARNAGAAA
jgi:heme exporter protein A